MCDHKETGTTAGGHTYCLDCAQHLPNETARDAALADSRVLRWRAAATAKPAPYKTYIGAKLFPHSGIWVLTRVQWCTELEQYIYAQEQGAAPLGIACPVDYIADDTLGVPLPVPGLASLPSVAA